MTEAVAGGLALLGLLATLLSLMYLHVAPTGLSPVRDAVSQYGITRYRTGYRVATISFGVAGALLAIGIATALSGRGVGLVVTSLTLFAAGRLVISWFPMDAPGAARTSTGGAHGLIAIVTFGSLAAAAFQLSSALANDQRWGSIDSVSEVLGWVMVASFVAMVLGRSSAAAHARFGLFERALYAAMITWCALVGVACLVQAR